MKKRWIGIVLSGALGLMLFAGCGSSAASWEGTSAGSSADNRVSQVKSMDGGSYESAAAGEAEYMEDADAYEEQETEDSVQLEGSEAAAEQQSSQKLIYTYRYNVETREFDQFVEHLTQKLTEFGGYIEASESNSDSDGSYHYMSLTLRVPTDKLEKMTSLVKKESNVVYSNVSSENVTLRYVDLQSHIKALRTEQETLLKLLEQAEKMKDIIELQTRLTDIRYELESYESQLRTYDNLIDYTTVYLDISEVERTSSNVQKQTFIQELRARFSDNFYSTGEILRELVIGLLSSLPLLAVLGVMVAVVVVVVRRILRWRKKRGAKKGKKEKEQETKE